MIPKKNPPLKLRIVAKECLHYFLLPESFFDCRITFFVFKFKGTPTLGFTQARLDQTIFRYDLLKVLIIVSLLSLVGNDSTIGKIKPPFWDTLSPSLSYRLTKKDTAAYSLRLLIETHASPSPKLP